MLQLVGFLLFFGNVDSEGNKPREYSMGALCGSEINMYREEIHDGLLVFSAPYYWSNYSCTINIIPNDFYSKWLDILAFNVTDYKGLDGVKTEFAEGDRRKRTNSSLSVLEHWGEKSPLEQYTLGSNKYLSINVTIKDKLLYSSGGMYFVLYFNLFRPPEDRCHWIKCANGRCIHDSLKCSDYNPCGDNSDCADEDQLSILSIVGIVAGVAGFFVIVGYCIKYRLQKEELDTDEICSSVDRDEFAELQPFYGRSAGDRTDENERTFNADHVTPSAPPGDITPPTLLLSGPSDTAIIHPNAQLENNEQNGRHEHRQNFDVPPPSYEYIMNLEQEKNSK